MGILPGGVPVERLRLSRGHTSDVADGAPGIAAERLADAMNRLELPGVFFRPVTFEPTFQKHAGRLARGFQIHVTNRARFRPVATTVALLCALRRVHRDAFAWCEPPYEYETERLPIDLICGTDRIRRAIDAGRPAREITGAWDGELAAFRERARGGLLYEDGDPSTA